MESMLDNLELMSKYKKNNWWFVVKRRNLRYLLRLYVRRNRQKKILDLGCGTGETSEIFDEKDIIFGIDNSKKALDYAKKNYKYLICCDAINLALTSSSFDIVICLDLLEHIKDDDLALKEIYRICKNGCILIINVPALKYLWSSRDVFLSHQRRYDIYTLRKKLLSVGFKIKKISYSNLIVFPFLFLFSKAEALFNLKLKERFKDIIKVNPILNKILIALLSVEKNFWEKIAFPFGTSLLCVAEK